VSRSSFYYQPCGESEKNLFLMKEIDRLHTQYPFYGARRICVNLPEEHQPVNLKKVRRLMDLMQIQTIYQKPNLSKANSEHKIYPYLLRNKVIENVNQVWSTDITYVPMKHGFLYLCAVVDWYSRFILSWELSNTLTVDFCIRTLQSAFEKWGKPLIFNSDQGSQFTSPAFTEKLLSKEIQISMDGKGRALDNVFIERFWRTIKYEHIYLHEYLDGKSLYAGLLDFIQFYNYERKHQSLAYLTPAQVYQQEKSIPKKSTKSDPNLTPFNQL
jgi:putative transposase